MKLNPDCIRDTMLALEEGLSLECGKTGYYFNSMSLSDVFHKIGKGEYPFAEVVYSILQLAESGYIVCSGREICNKSNEYFCPGSILYITPKGHEFIASIHNQEAWAQKVKPVLNALGHVSLSVIEAVSKGFAKAAIDRLMLNPPTETA